MSLLPQVKKFKWFTSEGARDQQADCGGVCSNQGSAQAQCGEDKDEPKGEALKYGSIYTPTVTHGHELWVVTGKQTSNM